jgi:hypothetical protein
MMPLEEEVQLLSRVEILEPLSEEDLSLRFNSTGSKECAKLSASA